jgi:hypothetical protein
MHFSRVFSVIVAQNSEQNSLAFYVGIPKVTILAPPLSMLMYFWKKEKDIVVLHE